MGMNEHMSGKHKGMCLYPQHPYKRLGIGLRVPVSQHGEVRQADPESPGASQLTRNSDFWFRERMSQENKEGIEEVS